MAANGDTWDTIESPLLPPSNMVSGAAGNSGNPRDFSRARYEPKAQNRADGRPEGSPEGSPEGRWTGARRTLRGILGGNLALSAETDSDVSSDSRLVGSRGRFQRAVARVDASNLYDPTTSQSAPYGFFNGRPIIGESTTINRGVYLGVFPQEALVVDERHGSLRPIFYELVSSITNLDRQGRLNEHEVLAQMCALVTRRIRFSPDGFEELVEKEGLEADNKTSLDLFLHAQIGLARHQVLLAGYLIERLKKRGVISGYLSLDGNVSDDFAQDDRLIYTSPSGRLFVFDPLKSYLDRAKIGLTI